MWCTPATRRSNRTILTEIWQHAKSLDLRPPQSPPRPVEARLLSPHERREHVLFRAWWRRGRRLPVAVWGTGNMGRAAIRAVDAHPGLELAAVIVSTPAKVGRDAGELAGLDRAARRRPRRRRRRGAGDARRSRRRRLHGLGRHPPRRRGRRRSALPARRRRRGDTGALRALRPPQRPGRAHASRCSTRPKEGGGALFVAGVDPGWGNDVLPVLVSGLAGTVDEVRCQEIFDYSTYDQPDSVRLPRRHGPADGLRAADGRAGVPTMVWGGQVRLIARALGRRARRDPRDARAPAARRGRHQRAWALFEAGTQGALRFEVQGIVDGEPRIVIEHVTRIDADCAPDWPLPPDGGDGAHRSSSRAARASRSASRPTDEGGNRAAGGNATAADRLVNAIPWLRAADPGLYDGLDVPLSPATGRLSHDKEHRMIIDIPEGKDPIMLRLGRDGARHRRRRVEVRAWPSTSTPRSGCASSRPPGCGSRRSTAACSARTGAPSATA